MSSRIRVLVVDDSAFFRRRITGMLGQEPGIEVVATAGDGADAVRQARKLKPDVITMDVEMPVLDGISAVKQVMAQAPTAIVMFSSLTREGARATLDALEAGAVDFLPKQGVSDSDSSARELTRRVLALGGCRRGIPTSGASAIAPAVSRPSVRGRNYQLVAIGASTGGPVAIQSLLSALPAGFPLPLLLVVHMPGSFTPAYAERLNSLSRIAVKEAVDGDQLRPGNAYLAPGGKQMLVERQGGGAVVRIRDSSSDQTYKPSVDISLGSAARAFPDSVLAIVLTGMGADGRQGARLLKQGGSSVWSQDEESCVVYGMPQAVEKAGLSDLVLPLKDIGPALGRLA